MVEVLLLMLVTFVPLIALVSASARVHQAALGVTAAAREAGSAAVSGVDLTAARERAAVAALAAMRDQQMSTAGARVSVSTSSEFGRGAEVHVRVSYPVRVLAIPFASDAVGPSVWVRASHVAHVDPYRSRP